MSFPNPLRGMAGGVSGWLTRVGEDGPGRMIWRWVTAMFGRRLVARKLIHGEEVLSHAMHSWIAYVQPVSIMAAGLVFGLTWAWFTPIDVVWFPLVVTLGVTLYGLYKTLEIARDRFVITDSRVFRVWGVFSLQEAEMEIVRVLDITVEQPWYLRLVGSGNLVLENAAQEQGLNRIWLIPQASERAMVIHWRRRKMQGLIPDDEEAQPEEEEAPPPAPPSMHVRRPRPVSARWHR